MIKRTVRIRRNSALCLACGTEARSFAKTKPGNCSCGALLVEGGTSFLKRTATSMSLVQDTSVVAVESSEEYFRRVVRTLHEKGTYPSPKAIRSAMGSDVQLNNLNGRECRWRREVFEEIGLEKQRPDASR